MLQITTNPSVLAMGGVACLVGGALWPITASAAAVSGTSAGGLHALLPWHFQPAAALLFVGAAVVWSGAFCSKVGVRIVVLCCSCCELL